MDETNNNKQPIPTTAPESKGMAITALVLGIVALILCWIPFVGIVGLVLGIVAIIMGIVGLKQSKGLAITGIVLGSLAILIGLLSIIVAVAYMDVLDPSGLITDSCIMPAGLSCVDQTYSGGKAQIMLRNNLGKQFTIVNVGMDDNYDDIYTPCVPDKSQIADGETFTITCPAEDTYGTGEHLFGNIKIGYREEGSKFDKIQEGCVTLTVN